MSLRNGPAQRRAIADEMAAGGVSLQLAEGFIVTPCKDIARSASDGDAKAGLGALRVNIFSFDPDLARTKDEIGVRVWHQHP